MAPRAIERGGMHVDEEIWNNVLKERIFQTGEEADHWNGFRATFTTWIRENRENSNRSSAPPEMPISGAEAFKVEWNAIRSVETSFNDSIALELKTFVEQCSQKATRNENVPILLAGGGSQMPGLLDALDRATQGKVLIWNDSEYATALGAAVSSTSSLWSQASNHQQTTSPTSATSSEKPSDSEEGSNKPPPAPRQPQAQAPAPQAQAPAPQAPNIRKQQVAGAQEAPTTIMSRLAIASMVLGILWLGWIGSLLAVIFGHVSLSQCRKNPHLRGRGFAIAGVTLGWIGLGISLFVGCCYIYFQVFGLK